MYRNLPPTPKESKHKQKYERETKTRQKQKNKTALRSDGKKKLRKKNGIKTKENVISNWLSSFF